jgi:hypothetical protein
VGAAASEKHDEHAKEEKEHGSKSGPHADAVVGIGTAAIVIDVIYDDLI